MCGIEHRLVVQRILHPPNEAFCECATALRNLIEINAGQGIAPRIEFSLYLFNPQNINIRRQPVIQLVKQIESFNSYVGAQPRNLPKGMNTSIGATRANDVYWLCKQSFRCGPKLTCNSARTLLFLPAVISRAIVFESQFPRSHDAPPEVFRMLRD